MLQRRRLPIRFCHLALALFVLWAAPLHAEKPAVTALFPTGGQIGQTVEVEPLGKLGTAPVQVWTDREDVSANISKDGKKLEITVSEGAVPGICWLRFWNNEGASPLRPFIVGRLPEAVETEPNETIEQAKADLINHVVNGKLHKSGELDTFKVSLKKGQTLVADLLGNTILGAPMDAVLQVFSSDGFLLGHADDSPKLDPTLAFTAPEDGEYFVRVFAFPETATSSIRYAGGADYIYRLTLTNGPYVHHTCPLVLRRGQQNPITALGWNLPAGGVLKDLTATSDNLTAELTFPSKVSLELRTVDHRVLNEESKDDLTPPFSLTGHIAQPDEIDTYPITAKKDQTLIVKVESASLGFPLDPVLEIKDAAGKPLAGSDDKSRGAEDAETTWKVPADGEYLIQIKDRYQHGGWDYAYLLTVETPKPTVRLSVAADAFTLTKDKPLEIPVTVARSNAFAEQVEVRITGLPEGFTAESVISEPKGETAKSVKLKITATGDHPFHGPIWITGQAEGTENSATTPATRASLKAQHAWISYQPKAK